MPEETTNLNPQSETEQPVSGKKSLLSRVIGAILKAVLVLGSFVMVGLLLGMMLLYYSDGSARDAGTQSNLAIMDKYDMFLTNEISSALEGVLSIEKTYWLSDSDLVAPEPNPANYGTANSPSELTWLLEEAKDLIGDRELLFHEGTPAWDGDKIYYYYDETILVITWKETVDRAVYTLSEVVIAHPSQFRRFLAGGKFGSDKQFITTEMAASVNAVVASSGDFYKYRHNGIVVYEGQLRRFEGELVDTCFINEDGDLLFAYRKEMSDEAQAQKFIEDNRVRFSLTFGPVLIDDGKVCYPQYYWLGQINEGYARAALCQKGDLHYLLASHGGEPYFQNRHTIGEFAENLAQYDVEKAYALDGGQTTVIAMDGQLINNVEYGYQRAISDIIYFATALPDGE